MNKTIVNKILPFENKFDVTRVETEIKLLFIQDCYGIKKIKKIVLKQIRGVLYQLYKPMYSSLTFTFGLFADFVTLQAHSSVNNSPHSVSHEKKRKFNVIYLPKKI